MTGSGAFAQSKMTPVGKPNSATRSSSATASSGRQARQGQKHDEPAVRLLVEFPRPVVDRANARGPQLRVPDRRDLLVGAVDEFGIDPVAIHVFAAIFGIGGAENSGLGLLRQARAGIAVDRPASHPGPADAAPRMSLDDPLPDAVRPLHDPRGVVLKFSRQALRPQIEGQVHQPAMTIRGHHPKPLFHRASPP